MALKVLLIGNYPNDQQESMRRFATLLEACLSGQGIETELLCPPTVFGRLIRSGQGVGKWLGYLDKFVLFPQKLKRQVRKLDSESVVHICDHSNAAYTPILRSVPHLVTCHDLLAIRRAAGEFPGHRTGLTGRSYQRWILHGLNRARRVACVSAATQRDLLRLSALEPHQVTVAHNGLNYPYAPCPQPLLGEKMRDLAERLGRDIGQKLKAGYILHVGGNQWYKNRLGAVQIFARLQEKLPRALNLVMVGKPFSSRMRRAIWRCGLENRVVELNSVFNEDLRTLYCGAELMLFPSIEEGFGWPIVEAQACGCRVATTNRPPMSDIGGESAGYFDLGNPSVNEDLPLAPQVADAAANAVSAILLENKDARQARIGEGLRNAVRFSIDQMLESYTRSYRQMLPSVVGEMCAKLAPNSIC